MRREGHIVFKLSDRAETRAPAHLDVLAGAARASGRIDGGGTVDRTVLSRVTGLRVRRIFHAARRLAHIGERASAYDDLEHQLGLPQALTMQIAEADRSDQVVAELRSLDHVEWAMVEPLAAAPFALDQAATTTRAFEIVGGLRPCRWKPDPSTCPSV